MMNQNQQYRNECLDNELLTRYRNGEEQAFRELVNRYKNPLYRFLLRFLNCQEIVDVVFQETFLKLYASQESFDIDRPLRPWLYNIAANKAKSMLRQAECQSGMNSETLVDRVMHR